MGRISSDLNALQMSRSIHPLMLGRFGQHLECAAVNESMYSSARSSPHSLRVYLYSAMCAAEFALESACVEALWSSALFTLDQRRADRFDLGAPFLLAPDEISDAFAVVGVVATFDLRLDPIVLLVG